MGWKIISKAEAVNEIRKNQANPMGGFFSVEFVKKDGSLRKMTCKMRVHKHLVNQAPRIPSTTHHIPKYITVYDVHSKGYRNINVTTFRYLNIGGESYMVS